MMVLSSQQGFYMKIEGFTDLMSSKSLCCPEVLSVRPLMEAYLLKAHAASVPCDIATVLSCALR